MSAEALEEVTAYREAARIIVRDSTLAVREKAIALARLGVRAGSTTVPEWVRAAVYEEAREFLGVAPTPPDVPGDAVEVSARSLRAKGYSACPTCARELHGEVDFQRWRALRQAYIDELEAREGAVPS